MTGIIDLFNWQNEISDKLHVRVTPKASSNHIKVEFQENGERLIRIYVTEVPESGKANKAAIKMLATELGVPKSALTIIRGATARNKIVQIERRERG